MTNYADFSYRTADLASDFGIDFAMKHFDEETLNKLPRYVRGKKAGKLKGCIGWTRCTRGGWVRNGEFGYVENRVGKIVEVFIYGPDTYSVQLRDMVPGGVVMRKRID